MTTADTNRRRVILEELRIQINGATGMVRHKRSTRSWSPSTRIGSLFVGQGAAEVVTIQHRSGNTTIYTRKDDGHE